MIEIKSVHRRLEEGRFANSTMHDLPQLALVCLPSLSLTSKSTDQSIGCKVFQLKKKRKETISKSIRNLFDIFDRKYQNFFIALNFNNNFFFLFWESVSIILFFIYSVFCIFFFVQITKKKETLVETEKRGKNNNCACLKSILE